MTWNKQTLTTPKQVRNVLWTSQIDSAHNYHTKEEVFVNIATFLGEKFCLTVFVHCTFGFLRVFWKLNVQCTKTVKQHFSPKKVEILIKTSSLVWWLRAESICEVQRTFRTCLGVGSLFISCHVIVFSTVLHPLWIVHFLKNASSFSPQHITLCKASFIPPHGIY